MRERSRSQFGKAPIDLQERGMSFDSIPVPRDFSGESEFARLARERKEKSLSPPPET